MAHEQPVDEDENDCRSDELEDLSVAEEWIARVDATLLAHTTKEFHKVAKIVDLAMKSLLDAPENLTECFYSRRIAHLVRSGQMESQGNLRRMRYSEVRLPGAPKNFKDAYFWISLAVSGSADTRPLRYWLEKAASALAPPEKEDLGTRIAACRPTKGYKE